MELLRHYGWSRCYRRVHGGCCSSRGATASRSSGCCTGIARVQPGELSLQLIEQSDFTRISTAGGESSEDRAADQRSTTGLCFADWGTNRCWGTGRGASGCTGRMAEVWLQAGQLGLDLRQQSEAWAAGIVACRHGLARCETRTRNAGRTAASAVRTTHNGRGISAKSHRRSQQ
jgi:hypothetical protein